MTTEEFSNAFDTLLNSHNTQSTQDIVLDEYEKSLFLTQAQLQLVTELYTGRNEKQASFESTEELRSNLRSLIKSISARVSESIPPTNTQEFDLPPDLLYIIQEEAIVGGKPVKVVPTTWDSLQTVLNNPFKCPNKNRVLRVDLNNKCIRVFREDIITEYNITYLAKPSPIILADLGDLKIDNESNITECMLDSSLHDIILKKAVVLALAVKKGQGQN